MSIYVNEEDPGFEVRAPRGYDNMMVRRTPQPVVTDPWPFSSVPVGQQKMFLPDGSVVNSKVPVPPAAAALGQFPDTQDVNVALANMVLWSLTTSAVIGGAFGAARAKPGGRAAGFGIGALVGIGVGMAAAGLAGRTAAIIIASMSAK